MKFIFYITISALYLACTKKSKESTENRINDVDKHISIVEESIPSNESMGKHDEKKTSDTITPTRKYQLPKPLNHYGVPYEKILKSINEQDWEEPVGGSGEGWETWLGKESFYPIGWSKSGNFSFLIHGVDEAEYSKLFIINAITNKNIYRTAGGDSTVEEFWKENKQEIEQQLSQHEIIQQQEHTLDMRTQLLPEITLKQHWAEAEYPFLKGTFGFLQSPYGTAVVTVDYYFYHNAGRGEGGTEFDVTGLSTILEKKSE